MVMKDCMYDTVPISVVMPAYNAEKTIAESIETVLKQTHENLELIIVDDASIDGTASIINTYARKNPQIRILRNTKNIGVAETRNKGIEAAKSDWIALLDSDDLWEPDKLERQIVLAYQEQAEIVYCSYDFIDEQGASIKKPFIVPRTTNFKQMLSKSVISCSTALIAARILKENLFDASFYHEDYALWMRLLSIPVLAVGDTKVLMHYRQAAGSRNGNKRKAAIERWKVYRGYLGMSFFQSLCAFIAYAFNGAVKYIG